MSGNAYSRGGERELAPRATPPGSEKLATPVVVTDGSQARPEGASPRSTESTRFGHLIGNNLEAFGGPRPSHVSDAEHGGVHDGSGRESTVTSALDSWDAASVPPATKARSNG